MTIKNFMNTIKIEVVQKKCLFKFSSTSRKTLYILKNGE